MEMLEKLLFVILFLFHCRGSVGKDNEIKVQPGHLEESDKFIGCHFNSLCYCKYDQRTEIYDSLKRLWHLAAFNETIFNKAVTSFQKEIKTQHNYFLDDETLKFIRNAIVNETNSHYFKFDPGPLFEFICIGAPIAVIPTDYRTSGVLSHVSISGSKLSILDGSSFAGLEVHNIVLSRNELYFLSEFAFSSMSNSLTVLDLSWNNLDEVPLAAFKTLKLLEWLNLSNNLLNRVVGDWMGVTVSLRQLTLSGNSIDVLPYKFFPAFSRLIWLDLSSNFIRNLTQDNLPPNLQTLILMKNPISQFPSAVFHLKSLSWLVLSGCAIERIPIDWPRGIGPLQMNQIDITENFIQLWPTRPFGSQLTVLDLDVSKNYIHKIPAAAFHSFSSFRISLAYNRLQSIDPHGFDTLEPTLQYLNLDNNRLKAIPWKSLGNLTNLMHLYVGSNQIRDDMLDPPSGKECKLTYLGLNGNELTRVPRRLMTGCPNLLHLNLGYNTIGHLDDLAHLSLRGKKMRNLSTLVLRNNPIHTLSYDVTEGSSGSLELDPDDEETASPHGSILNVFKPEVFPNLYELSLSFCELSGEVPDFPALQLTNLEISMGLKSATTVSPSHFQALRQLEWLALDHNSIHTISDYSFYSNKNLSYVNLEFNRLGMLPRQMFHPDIHHSINQLRLSHNKIKILLSENFLSFPATNLDLSYNNIHTVEKHAFTIATATTSANGGTPTQPLSSSTRTPSTNPDGLTVYLNHNRVTTLKPSAFAQEKLTLLDLSYNSLTYFNFDVFGRKTVVGGLNLSHNAIEKVSQNKKHLIKFLDLSFNKLTHKGMNIQKICPTDSLQLSFNGIQRVDAQILPTNCSCKQLNLKGNHISSLDPDSFTNLRDLTVLDISWNEISSVPEILFIRNHKLTYLDMSHNRIRTLPRDSMVGSNVEILLLGSNQFVNLPVGALSQISRRLKRLDMSENALEHLDSTMFEPIPGIVHLNLSYNRLSILPDNAFANLAALRELDLSGNFLRANFKELFHFLPKLKVLRLVSCGMKVLPGLPLPHLISLDLSSNGLLEIKMQSLQSLTRLRHLDLSSNELNSNSIPNWTPLANLISLKLNRNPLRSLTKDSFVGLDGLEELEIVDMGGLDRFDSDSISYLTNLKRLAVETYPNIEKYRFRLGAVLSGIAQLESLKVQIKEQTLSDQLFGGILPKTRKLTIIGKNLRKIEPNAFDGLQNCLHMDLKISETSVDEIPSRIFQLLQNAEWARLDLSNNKLSALPAITLYPNNSLWFAKGTKLLQGGLILSGNEFVCDCNLVWIGEWLRRWLRESFESHTTAIPIVQEMYEEIRAPTCMDSKGNSIPLIELYTDVLCHASALSAANFLQASTTLLLFLSTWRVWTSFCSHR